MTFSFFLRLAIGVASGVLCLRLIVTPSLNAVIDAEPDGLCLNTPTHYLPIEVPGVDNILCVLVAFFKHVGTMNALTRFLFSPLISLFAVFLALVALRSSRSAAAAVPFTDRITNNFILYAAASQIVGVSVAACFWVPLSLSSPAVLSVVNNAVVPRSRVYGILIGILVFVATAAAMATKSANAIVAFQFAPVVIYVFWFLFPSIVPSSSSSRSHSVSAIVRLYSVLAVISFLSHIGSIFSVYKFLETSDESESDIVALLYERTQQIIWTRGGSDEVAFFLLIDTLVLWGSLSFYCLLSGVRNSLSVFDFLFTIFGGLIISPGAACSIVAIKREKELALTNPQENEKRD